MSDKSPSLPAPFFALPGHRVLAMEGRDAAVFAQAQFTNDVEGLADGHWQWSAWLTPKGRIVALFALLRLDAERLWLVLPDADPAALAAQLQRFVFRTKVTLRPLEEVHAAASFTPPEQAAGAVIAGDTESGLELDLGTPAGARTLRLGTAVAAADAEAAARWTAFDLAHGWPRLDPEQVEKWTPQQLSLLRLRAYSVKKGCYPGQEIVARTHFLGQAKRGLVRLQGAASAASGDAVMSGEREIGRVVCSAGGEALAVLPLELDDAELAVGDSPCQLAALEDGLAR